jgi:tetratricopeptide (TPR) repeat protein
MSSGPSWPRLAGIGLAVALAACAPALPPVPVVTAPRYPDFVYPTAPATMARPDVTLRLERGWLFLQAGDTRGARRELMAALKLSGAFFPAEAGLAYASLADRDYGDAISRFDRVLVQSPMYVPALVGRGDAFIGSGHPDEAIRSFQAALASDPGLVDVRRRLDVLALRTQQESLLSARQAADAGRYDEAVSAYERAIAGSPDSAFLYRELASIERKQGHENQALEHLRKAAALDPSDARPLVQIGEMLEARGDYSGAAAAYAQAQAVDPSEETAALVERARARVDLAKLPEEYRAIANAPQVTRGELAALIGVQLSALVQDSPRRESVVVTDMRNHWAAAWILAVVRAGIMEPYANHTFVPRGVVRRLDLAQVVSRILALIGTRRPLLAQQWAAARPRIGDIPPGHLGYPAVAMAVGADVMALVDGSFRPARPVTGAEAIDAIGRLQVLAR